MEDKIILLRKISKLNKMIIQHLLDKNEEHVRKLIKIKFKYITEMEQYNEIHY